MKTMNEGVVSDWMDCYRHLAITALFLNESLALHPLSPPPSNFSSLMLSAGYVLHLPVSRLIWLLQPSHHIWIRDLSHSWVWSYCDSFWQCPYCPPFHPSSGSIPSTFPNTLALSTNALPRICPSFQGRQMPPSSQRTPDPPFKLFSCFRNSIVI